MAGILNSPKCFNSQPPEGGWPRWRLQPCKRAWFQLTAARRRLVVEPIPRFAAAGGFNSQPPEGGWEFEPKVLAFAKNVSTHSRPKAAGSATGNARDWTTFQLTAARRRLVV